MHDGQHRTGLCRVDILEAVPCSRGGPRLGLAITNNACHDEVRVVHDSAERHAERVTELATLVDGTRGFGVDMACSWEG